MTTLNQVSFSGLNVQNIGINKKASNTGNGVSVMNQQHVQSDNMPLMAFKGYALAFTRKIEVPVSTAKFEHRGDLDSFSFRQLGFKTIQDFFYAKDVETSKVNDILKDLLENAEIEDRSVYGGSSLHADYDNSHYEICMEPGCAYVRISNTESDSLSNYYKLSYEDGFPAEIEETITKLSQKAS